MLVVALLISTLAVRLRDQGVRAREREERTRVLYTVGRELGSLRRPERSRALPRTPIGEVFHGPAQVLLPDAEGRLAAVPVATPGFPADARERAVAEWAFAHARPAGLGTDTLPGSSALYLPLPGGDRPVGVLGVQPAREPAAPLARISWACSRRWHARSPHRCRPRVCRRKRTARSARGGTRAAARHAAELRVARPAHAARRHHRRGQHAARGRRARRRAAGAS